MSNSAINTQVAQLKVGNVQNQADTSAVYNAGNWSFKNSTALTSVTITDAGNVGIGKSPTYRLDIQGAIGENATLAGFFSGTNTTRGFTIGLSAGGGAVNDGYVVYNHTLGGGNSGHIWQAGGAERMRIDASGNVTVSTGDLLVSGSTKLIGAVGSYNTTTASAANAHILSNGYILRSSSALKYKEDITPISHGLQTVLSMQPIEYKSKCEADKDAAHKFIGFVADWEETNLPALVQKNGEGEVEGFSYDRLTAVLCKAIQELSAKVEEQSSRIDAQAEEIKALKAKP